MSMTDPIADMLARIRNGLIAGHERVDIPASKLKAEIAKILKTEGFISDYKLAQQDQVQGTLRVFLRYTEEGDPIIHGMKRVSRPGRRVYRRKAEIPQVLDGLGVSILSTSHGVLSGDAAKQAGIGGEILCQVW